MTRIRFSNKKTDCLIVIIILSLQSIPTMLIDDTLQKVTKLLYTTYFFLVIDEKIRLLIRENTIVRLLHLSRSQLV